MKSSLRLSILLSNAARNIVTSHWTECQYLATDYTTILINLVWYMVVIEHCHLCNVCAIVSVSDNVCMCAERRRIQFLLLKLLWKIGSSLTFIKLENVCHLKHAASPNSIVTWLHRLFECLLCDGVLRTQIYYLYYGLIWVCRYQSAVYG